jgi:thioredoxin reductase (NADPH)
LKKHYEARYRVLRAESGRAALDLLRRLQRRNDAVALLLLDHRMPEMNGVELLHEAIKLYPNARRTLLAAYVDTEAAIKAINEVQINQYLETMGPARTGAFSRAG